MCRWKIKYPEWVCPRCGSRRVTMNKGDQRCGYCGEAMVKK
jgi:predicted RNA-binding Zn-ribbon protein involved in translation (DUF1610 family)